MPNPKATDPWLERRGHVGTLNLAVRTEDKGPEGGENKQVWPTFACKGNLGEI